MRRWRCRNTRLKSLPSASRLRAFEHSVWRKKLKVTNAREESGNEDHRSCEGVTLSTAPIARNQADKRAA